MHFSRLWGSLPVLLLLAAVRPAVADESDVAREIERLRVATVRDQSAPGRPVVAVVWQTATDRGLERLVTLLDLAQTRSLNLTGARITDAGLVHLEKLNRLQDLSLKGTAITDAGLKHLHGLPRLHTLRLLPTKVTDKGVAEFRKALPGATVEHKYVAPNTGLLWYGGRPRFSPGRFYQGGFPPGR